MQIIHDSNAVFDVTVNPFLCRIRVMNLESGDAGAEMLTWNYTELDEWYSTWFTKGNGKVEFDFHFEYDEKMKFSIYPVIAGNTNTLSSLPYNLHIEL